MLRIFGIAVATLLAFPSAAAGQKGQQIFDLFLQGAQQEAYRQQQREHERRQRQELNQLYQQFVAEWQACHSGALVACDRALAYPQASGNDRQALFNKRSQIVAAEQEAAQRAYRQRAEAEQEARERQHIATEIEARRRQQEVIEAAQRQQAHQQRLERELRAVLVERERDKAATIAWVWAGGTGLLLAAAGLGALLFRTQLLAAWAAVIAKLRSAPAAPAHASQAAHVPAEEKTAASEPVAEKSPTPAKPRDTNGAMAAMELALAYIQEVQDANRPGLEDEAERKHQLNTLALAAKQLGLAERLDADAILEGESDAGPFRFSVNELKAEALLLEGTTHQLYDLRRAIPALVAATQLNPNSAHAFYVLGLTHAANMSKGKAIAAFEQAVALDPKNIAYRKELNRAQSLSGAEVAAYHATRAGEKLVDGSVMAWNIFAVIWNVLTFPLRVVVGIFRLLRLHPFA